MWEATEKLIERLVMMSLFGSNNEKTFGIIAMAETYNFLEKANNECYGKTENEKKAIMKIYVDNYEEKINKLRALYF